LQGWVPLHFTNETGLYGIPDRFRPFLKETSTTASAKRTELNMKDADGILTLLIEEDKKSEVSPGTQYGIDYAVKLGKSKDQLFFVDLSSTNAQSEASIEGVVRWIKDMYVKKCAIGGPRESEAPGIQDVAYHYLVRVFTVLASQPHQ